MKCTVTLYSSLFLVISHLLACFNNYLGTFLCNSRGDSIKMCILSHFNKYGVGCHPLITNDPFLLHMMHGMVLFAKNVKVHYNVIRVPHLNYN